MLNTKYKKKLGKTGENIATKFLIQNGFEIIIQNYQKRGGEIDIIAFKKGVIHFFEVKTVTRETYDLNQNNFHKPEENVTLEKIRKIEKTANLFLTERGFTDECIQIDLLTVCFVKGSKDDYLINYLPNINFI